MVRIDSARPPARITTALLGCVLTSRWRGISVPATLPWKNIPQSNMTYCQGLASELSFLLLTHFRFAVAFGVVVSRDVTPTALIFHHRPSPPKLSHLAKQSMCNSFNPSQIGLHTPLPSFLWALNPLQPDCPSSCSGQSQDAYFRGNSRSEPGSKHSLHITHCLLPRTQRAQRRPAVGSARVKHALLGDEARQQTCSLCYQSSSGGGPLGYHQGST